MVQKAVQQLLFDVEWTTNGEDLDVLVVDMPPGTGDVQLSLGQLVVVDGECFVWGKGGKWWIQHENGGGGDG